jgi:hypothetical protein
MKLCYVARNQYVVEPDSPHSGLVQLCGGANGGGRQPFADSCAWCPPPSLTSAFGCMRKSNIPKPKKLKTIQAEKSVAQERMELSAGLKAGTIIPVDKSKVFSRSVLPKIPDYYRDRWFTCKDCGEGDLWTAKQQKRWYEEQGGEIEAIAIRCRVCRRKEKSRRELARRVHLDGLARKRARMAQQKD